MKTILILAANPRDTNPLRLDKEVQQIQEGLRRSKQGLQFDVAQQWATRPLDIHRAMLDHEPKLVHFCGHGEGELGIILEDDSGNSQHVSSDALAAFFKLFAGQVECIAQCVLFRTSSGSDCAAYRLCHRYESSRRGSSGHYFCGSFL